VEDIDDGLSPEDLVNIARLSIKPVYRAYFNLDSGDILAVSNEIRDEYDHGIIIPYEQFESFVIGREQLKDWAVIKTKNPDNEYGVDLVQKEFQGQTFRNHMFEWIVDKPNKQTEMIVHWDEHKQHWIFMISDSARQRYYDKKITTKVIKFFITLNTDLDFLIRTIDIDLKSLVADKVVVPFQTNIETQLDIISISSKTVFDSYGLKVWKTK
jgi:hypothetical protein